MKSIFTIIFLFSSTPSFATLLTQKFYCNFKGSFTSSSDRATITLFETPKLVYGTQNKYITDISALVTITPHYTPQPHDAYTLILTTIRGEQDGAPGDLARIGSDLQSIQAYQFYAYTQSKVIKGEGMLNLFGAVDSEGNNKLMATLAVDNMVFPNLTCEIQ